MKDLTRRDFMKVGTAAGAVLSGTAAASSVRFEQGGGGFQAASQGPQGGPGSSAKRGPGIQSVTALCEVTGGGQKVYGIAVQYDAAIVTVRRSAFLRASGRCDRRM